jgi:hypothetical protein
MKWRVQKFPGAGVRFLARFVPTPPYPSCAPRALAIGAMGAHGGEPPPIPFTVEQLVGEISSERAATAQQACAAFAQLATRAPIPASFRGAVPAVLSVVERRDEHGFDVAARESAVAALVALCACVEGAAEDAVANGAVAKLLAAAAVEADRRLDLNALECLRVLATARAASAALVADDAAMDAAFAFVAERAVPGSGPDPNLTRADPVAAAALDLLCGLASKRSDEGAARRAVVERGAVGVLAKALAATRDDEVAVRALLGLAMTTNEGAQQAELAATPGAAAATLRFAKSTDRDVAEVAKRMWARLGSNADLKPTLAAALRESVAETRVEEA